MIALIDKHCSNPSCNYVGDNFHKASFYCKTCANAKSRAWHAIRENLDKRNARVNVKQKENKEWAVAYKGGSCERCKSVFPTCVFDFHHVDGSDKEGNPSYFIKMNRERAKVELDKCILLCANCHRLEHFN